MLDSSYIESLTRDGVQQYITTWFSYNNTPANLRIIC